MTSMTVGTVAETAVSADYTLVTVEWAATFERSGDAPIQFSISYILRQSEDDWKVAGYISHEDQEVAMRAHDLL